MEPVFSRCCKLHHQRFTMFDLHAVYGGRCSLWTVHYLRRGGGQCITNLCIKHPASTSSEKHFTHESNDFHFLSLFHTAQKFLSLYKSDINFELLIHCDILDCSSPSKPKVAIPQHLIWWSKSKVAKSQTKSLAKSSCHMETSQYSYTQPVIILAHKFNISGRDKFFG